MEKVEGKSSCLFIFSFYLKKYHHNYKKILVITIIAIIIGVKF